MGKEMGEMVVLVVVLVVLLQALGEMRALEIPQIHLPPKEIMAELERPEVPVQTTVAAEAVVQAPLVLMEQLQPVEMAVLELRPL